MKKSLLMLLVLVNLLVSGGKLQAAQLLHRLVIVPESVKVAPLGTVKFKVLVKDIKGKTFKPARVSWRTDGGDIGRDGRFRAPNEKCTVVVTAMVEDMHAWVKVLVEPKRVVRRRKGRFKGSNVAGESEIERLLRERKQKRSRDEKKHNSKARRLARDEARELRAKAKKAEAKARAAEIKAKEAILKAQQAKTKEVLEQKEAQELIRRLELQEHRLELQERRLAEQGSRLARHESRLAEQERLLAFRESDQTLRVQTLVKRPSPVEKQTADKKLTADKKQTSRQTKVKQAKPQDGSFLFQRQVMDVLQWRVTRVDKEKRQLQAIIRVEHPAAKELEVFALCSRSLVRKIKTLKVRPARTVELKAQFEANNVRQLGVRLVDGKGNYLAATTRGFSR